jgi:hypothetical protein
MFELEAIKEEKDILEALLTDIKENANGRMADMCKVQ